MGHSPLLTSPTWVLPWSCSSSQTAPTCVSSTGYSSSGGDCFCMGPHGETLPAKLFQCGVLFPLVCRSCQEPALALTAHRVTISGHPSVSVWGPPGSVGGSLLHCGPLWAAGGQPVSPQSSPQASGESAPTAGAPPPPHSPLTL